MFIDWLGCQRRVMRNDGFGCIGLFSGIRIVCSRCMNVHERCLGEGFQAWGAFYVCLLCFLDEVRGCGCFVRWHQSDIVIFRLWESRDQDHEIESHGICITHTQFNINSIIIQQ